MSAQWVNVRCKARLVSNISILQNFFTLVKFFYVKDQIVIVDPLK